MDRYNFKTVEEKWQKLWEEEKTFSAKVEKKSNLVSELGEKILRTAARYKAEAKFKNLKPYK